MGGTSAKGRLKYFTKEPGGTFVVISGVKMIPKLSATNRFVDMLHHLQEMSPLLTAPEKLSWMMCSAGGMRNICGSVLKRGGVERSMTVTVMPVLFAPVKGDTFA